MINLEISTIDYYSSELSDFLITKISIILTGGFFFEYSPQHPIIYSGTLFQGIPILRNSKSSKINALVALSNYPFPYFLLFYYKSIFKSLLSKSNSDIKLEALNSSLKVKIRK